MAVFVARLVIHSECILCVTIFVHRFMQEAEKRKLELKRITAALKHLTPDQRKNVAVELAALDA